MPAREYFRRHRPLSNRGGDKPGHTESLPPDSERLTLEDAIRAYTIDAAYLLDAETYIGSLEVGKRADLIIVDTDLFQATPDEIAATKVLMTMMNGRIVHGEGVADRSQEDFDEFEDIDF